MTSCINIEQQQQQQRAGPSVCMSVCLLPMNKGVIGNTNRFGFGSKPVFTKLCNLKLQTETRFIKPMKPSPRWFGWFAG